MKKIVFTLCAALLLSGGFVHAQSKKNDKIKKEKAVDTQSIYQFKVEDLSGETFDFATLKGKKVLIVNTASKCGYTPQYEQLEAIYKEYKDKGFVVIGFPANNFNSQEPGTNKDIETFCKLNYGVSFPMMAKISVKGNDMSPIYQFLTQKDKNGVKDSEVKWNFQKYLIDEKGHLAEVYFSKTKPDAPEIVNWIKQ
ncbi:glutathione peroxidase [Flavobacterium seoulense]|uniref:Glutathione peroxidase n=1 Tax=Flavobacterium seoulense TaxID=1492738 RepID=A0A066WY21_9FLAO|nr:glutathione peroxidase [Flavobacterium seoulense]KDN55570.1 glutathione peroxidase [Flavobacterium seoulense]